MTESTKWWEIDKWIWRPGGIFILWAAVIEGWVAIGRLVAELL